MCIRDSGNGLDRSGDRRHTGRHAQRGDAAFHRGDTLFQHVLRRIHDSRIDVAGYLQIEQICAMLGAVEGVGGGLVDRHGDRFGRGFRAVASVDGEGFEFHPDS